MKSNSKKPKDTSQQLLLEDARSTASSFTSTKNARILNYNNSSTMGLDRSSSSNSSSSETSATVIMNHKFKQNILRNHLFLIILLTSLQLGALIFAIIWPPWYDDTQDITANHGVSTFYGLLLTFSGNHISLNRIHSENNKEIGGISSFALFSVGVLVELLQFAQLIALFKRYSSQKVRGIVESIAASPRSWKVLKFKSCRRISFFFYVSAMSYWVVVVFLVQVVTDASNYSELMYGFWVTLASILGFIIISVYFNFLKKRIRKNDMVSQMLLASQHSSNRTSYYSQNSSVVRESASVTPTPDELHSSQAQSLQNRNTSTPINDDDDEAQRNDTLF